MLKSIVEAAIGTLTRCFEKYYAVSNDAANGILDGDVAATESPAPVLHQAVLLAGAVYIYLHGLGFAAAGLTIKPKNLHEFYNPQPRHACCWLSGMVKSACLAARWCVS